MLTVRQGLAFFLCSCSFLSIYLYTKSLDENRCVIMRLMLGGLCVTSFCVGKVAEYLFLTWTCMLGCYKQGRGGCLFILGDAKYSAWWKCLKTDC